MPNIKSAKKRLRTSTAAQVRNAGVRTRVKTARRSLREALAGADKKVQSESYALFCSVLDNAAKKGVYKKDTAIRQKRRAAAQLAKAGPA